MALLARIADALARGLALIAAIGVLVMMLHVCIDILSRNLFRAAVPATVEIVSRYYMVLIAFLPLAWVERRQGMVAVEVTEQLMSARVRRWSDIAVAILACVIYAGLVYAAWAPAMRAAASGTFVMALMVPIPVWPTYFLPPIGFALAALACGLRAVLMLAGHDEKAVAPETTP